MNTKRSGLARIIIFKSRGFFKAVCLDFDIIEEADNRVEVEKNIREAVLGYIENICKNNLDEKLLNRRADKRYWNMYYKYLELIGKEKSKKTFLVNNVINNTSFFTMPIKDRVSEVCKQ